MIGRKSKKKIKVKEQDSVEEVVSESDEEVSEDSEELELDAQEESAEEVAETSEESEKSEDDDLTKLRKEFHELSDRFMRLNADFDNYKKRVIKERSDLIKYEGQKMAHDLLEVLDNLDLALNQDVKGEFDDFIKGVDMVRNRFRAVLEQFGIKGDDAVGKAFDPKIHEAIASVESEDHEPGFITEEFKKAYHFKDRLLRPAKVVVAKKPEAKEEESGEEE